MAELLQVHNLSVDYLTLGDTAVRAVDDVSFHIDEQQSLGLAGESGCGKSTIAYALMRLHKPPALITGGQVRLMGEDILAMDEHKLRTFRWNTISMVFQSAMNCLNPVVKIRKQFFEIYKHHGITRNRGEARNYAEELMALVGIPLARLDDYPHQLSGGMRQRVVIAMALALRPRLLILDEPTTALDTVVQREIMQEIDALKKNLGFSILFITHDLSLMIEFCDTVAVMYAGKFVEQASSKNIIDSPRHPYTHGLKNSFPSLHGDIEHLEGIPGTPLNLRNVPAGCRFQERCFAVRNRCRDVEPERTTEGNRFFTCHYPLKNGGEGYHRKYSRTEHR